MILSLQKYLSHNFILERVWSKCEKDEYRRRIAILTHNFLIRLFVFSFSAQVRVWGHCPNPGHSPAALVILSFCDSLWLRDCETDCIYWECLHVWFHNTYLFTVVNPCDLLIPTHNCLSVYSAGTYCLRIPWLSALSKVNMQHYLSIYLSKPVCIYIYIYTHTYTHKCI